MSLSSPHLGYIYSKSNLVDAGMWILKKWKKSKSLEQLSLSDTSDLSESCLFKLSESPGLNWFKHVYLVSSHQDFYAPFESTRIQLCAKALEETKYFSIFYNKIFEKLIFICEIFIMFYKSLSQKLI